MASRIENIAIIGFIVLIVVICGTIAFTLNDLGTTFEENVAGLIFMIVFTLFVFWAIFSKTKKHKKRSAFTNYTKFQDGRRGWTPDQKEQVRIRQDGKCAHCGKPPPRWEYHHIDGNRSNNSMSNCEGLCPNCHSVETHE
jgi:hypothetical protein